ncbi:MAG: hypothetical protein GWP08_17400 [Nitrospiraceae bacterium]|nr:hypothetical protein [Nitrospiraceae bacterium]
MTTEHEEHHHPEPEAEPKRSQHGLLACVLAIALVVFMLLFIPTGPLKKYRRSSATLGDLREQLKLTQLTIEAEQERLRSQDQLVDRLNQRSPSFDLWSFLNRCLTETSLNQGHGAELEKVTPRGRSANDTQDVTLVELKLTNLTLNQLVNFLYKVHGSNNLVVMRRLEYLRPAADRRGLECSISFLSPNAPQRAAA